MIPFSAVATVQWPDGTTTITPGAVKTQRGNIYRMAFLFTSQDVSCGCSIVIHSDDSDDECRIDDSQLPRLLSGDTLSIEWDVTYSLLDILTSRIETT